MEFTCPNCKCTFTAPSFKGSTSKAANAARKRNAQLAGRKAKAPADVLSDVFFQLFKTQDTKPWTWEDFQKEVKKRTGVTYSRAQVFTILKKLKAEPAAKGTKTSFIATFASEGVQPEGIPAGVKTSFSVRQGIRAESMADETPAGKKVKA